MKVIVASTYEQAILAAGMLRLRPDAWRYAHNVQDLRVVAPENIVQVLPRLEEGYVAQSKRFDLDVMVAHIERTQSVSIERVHT